MTIRRGLLAISACALLGGAVYVPLHLYAAPDPWPRHTLPSAQDGGTVVGLCDGKTSIEVPWLKPGHENPVKGKPLSPDDPKLRAFEAYIIARRSGVPIAYGKH
jgi:hypothetical protein